MTLSTPLLQDSTAYYNSGTGQIFALWLWTNTGGYGFCEFRAYKEGTTTLIKSMKCCFPIRVGLKNLNGFDITTTPIPNFYDLKAYKCNSDTEQTCPPVGDPTCIGTCTNIIQQYPEKLSTSIRLYSSTSPNKPPNLTITPGDRKLTVSWGEVINVEIFTYLMSVYSGAILIERGYTLNNERLVDISGLENGVTYSIEVSAISHSTLAGAPATGTGTPVCPSVSCAFIIPA